MTAPATLPSEVPLEALPVARVYAAAAWNIVHAMGQGADFLAELTEFITGVVNRTPALQQIFKTGALSQDARDGLLTRWFAGKVGDPLLSLLRTLNRHDRLALLWAVHQGVHELHEASLNRVAVQVRSAVALETAQLDKLRQVLAQRFAVDPQIHVTVDPNVLGGLWIKVADTVYDRSVRRNLEQLKENILTRRTHEV